MARACVNKLTAQDWRVLSQLLPFSQHWRTQWWTFPHICNTVYFREWSKASTYARPTALTRTVPLVMSTPITHPIVPHHDDDASDTILGFTFPNESDEHQLYGQPPCHLSPPQEWAWMNQWMSWRWMNEWWMNECNDKLELYHCD